MDKFFLNMRRFNMRNNVILAITFLLLLTNCIPPVTETPQVESRKNPLLYRFNETINFADLQEGDILAATDITLAEAATILDEILAVLDESRTFENTILRLDDIYNIVGKVDNPAGLMSQVHTSAAIRDEADSSMILFSKFMNDLSVNEDLYNAIVAYGKTEEGKNLIGVKKNISKTRSDHSNDKGLPYPKKNAKSLLPLRIT